MRGPWFPVPWLQAGKYVNALVSDLPKRNGWTIAEQVGDRTPQRTQRLLNRAVWDTFVAMGVVRAFAVAGLDEAACRLGRRAGPRVGAIDEGSQQSRAPPPLARLATTPPSPLPLVPPAHPARPPRHTHPGLHGRNAVRVLEDFSSEVCRSAGWRS
jgi:hypothetical protein